MTTYNIMIIKIKIIKDIRDFKIKFKIIKDIKKSYIILCTEGCPILT